ncbi:hypothetical protein [Rhizobium giardinii]|uniref:hypothetical protein n=1 Tax=Rhizobium giardinii TaxID=56731 RepID=UPI003D6F006A
MALKAAGCRGEYAFAAGTTVCPQANQRLFDLQFYNQLGWKIASNCGGIGFSKGHFALLPSIVSHVDSHPIAVECSPEEIQAAAFAH